MEKTTKKIALHWISQLVHCTSIGEAKNIFTNGWMVFANEWTDENLETYVNKILPEYSRNEKIEHEDDNNSNSDLFQDFFENEDDNTIQDKDTFEDKPEEEMTKTTETKLRHGSPFYILFNNIYIEKKKK